MWGIKCRAMRRRWRRGIFRSLLWTSLVKLDVRSDLDEMMGLSLDIKGRRDWLVAMVYVYNHGKVGVCN